MQFCQGEKTAYLPPRAAIEADAAIDIAAPPEYVVAVYRNVEKWSRTFPATIESACITRSGANWKQIEVKHKKEGRVLNTLIDLSDTEIVLEEIKRKYDASFLNRFELTAGEGTHYVIQAYIHLKGIYTIFKPLLKDYVRRQARGQMMSYVLKPLKTAVEKSIGDHPK